MKRLVLAPACELLLLSIIGYILSHHLLGNAADAWAAGWKTSTALDANQNLLLHQTLDATRVSYFHWLVKFLEGDWGISSTYHVPVKDRILQAAQGTVWTATLAFLGTYLLALLFGTWLATRTGRIRSFTQWILMILAMQTPIVPALFVLQSGLPWWPQIWAGVILAALSFTTVALIWEKRLRDFLLSPLVRSLRARGLPEQSILLKYAGREGLIVCLASLPDWILYFFAGTIVLESIFNIPGIGRLTYQAALERDVSLLLALLILFALLRILATFLSDTAHSVLAPQSRVSR